MQKANLVDSNYIQHYSKSQESVDFTKYNVMLTVASPSRPLRSLFLGTSDSMGLYTLAKNDPRMRCMKIYLIETSLATTAHVRYGKRLCYFNHRR